MRKKILIVDDHRIFIDSLTDVLLQTELYEIDKCYSIEEAISKFNKFYYDILISDIEFPELDGIFLISYVRKLNDKIKIIALTSYSNPSLLKRLDRLKVDAYLNKNINKIDLLHTLKTLHENQFHFSSSNEEKEELTPREIDVLKLILDEKTSKEIAQILEISLPTVESHRKNLLQKTNSTNMVGLAKYAIIKNII